MFVSQVNTNPLSPSSLSLSYVYSEKHVIHYTLYTTAKQLENNILCICIWQKKKMSSGEK